MMFVPNFQVSSACSSTRAVIMGGRLPFRARVTHTLLQRKPMASGNDTLPQGVKSAGYIAGLFGAWHLDDEDAFLPRNRGFDEVLMHGTTTSTRRKTELPNGLGLIR